MYNSDHQLTLLIDDGAYCRLRNTKDAVTIMRSSIAAAALVALLATAPAFAEDFPATPISPAAPTNLPGEDLVPGLREALTVVNGITQPILQPVLAPGAPIAAGPSSAEAALARHHHHRRFAHRAPKHHNEVAHLHHHGAAHKAA